MRIISYVVFKDLVKRYKGSKKDILKNINIDIEKGEFIVIVGPSGSGKSTLLELICGFEDITDGYIEIDNKIINEVEPKDRNISMVFQNYALLPHLTVYENIAFGMKIRKTKKDEIHKKVMWASKILELDDYLHVKPKKLSGGQRQRVALARAIVREPKLFLMDEPLSNLDSKLRNQTSNEITTLHKKINATTIYVTHDQTEALTMADRIVVLNDGEIQQVGTPKEIYNNPYNTFVAMFIGKPEMNLFNIKIENRKLILENKIILEIPESLIEIKEDEYILGFRAENINVDRKDKLFLNTKIEKIQYLGDETILHLNHSDLNFTAKTYGINNFEIGEEVSISFDFKKANIFNKHNKINIKGEKHEKKNN